MARHRWLATLAALAVLVPLCVAALGLRLGEPSAAVLAQSGPAREALDRLERAGVSSGVLTPIEVLLPAGADREAAAGRLGGVAGVQLAVAPTGPAWTRDDSGLVSVLPVAETSTDAGEATVERVRELAATELPGARVGGSGALVIDATASLYGSFPLMLAVVSLVTFVLLARAFRSLLLALKAILLNLLSIGAAYGVLVLVWQEGYGSEAIWGIPATGAIAMWVPLMAFAFLYGLSMDYEVFLLARMREEYDGTGSTETAIVRGLGRVGRLVTCAALILFLSFASMAAIPELDVKIMATALGPASSSTRPSSAPSWSRPWSPSWAAGTGGFHLGGPPPAGSALAPAPEPAEPAREQLVTSWCRPAGCGTVSSRSCGARAGRPLGRADPQAIPRAGAEAVAPGRVGGPPAQLPLRLGVGRPADLVIRTSRARRPAVGQPRRHLSRRLRPDGRGQGGQPLRDRRRVVVDDVVHAGFALLDGGHGGRGRVVDVDERPDTAAPADDR